MVIILIMVIDKIIYQILYTFIKYHLVKLTDKIKYHLFAKSINKIPYHYDKLNILFISNAILLC